MTFQGNYVDNHGLPQYFKIDNVPMSNLDLQSKFGWGNPLIKPKNSPEWRSFERWLINNYLPKAESITSCSQIG